jgi:Rhodopirellula transposase DDE domain
MIEQAVKTIVKETAAELSGYERRHFMAKVVKELCQGNARAANRALGWNRGTLKKALAEWDGQFCLLDHYAERGRKPSETYLPDLLEDIGQIADEASQTDPTFQSMRLYTRLSAAEVRRQLIEQKGYSAEQLPCEDTIRRKLNQLGYLVKAVQKSQPLKKIPQTDAIFAQLHKVNPAAAADPTVLRISWDAKAPVLLGRFSRDGVSRLVVKAWDHDFQAHHQKVTPFGIYLPETSELFLYLTTSKITSDFIVDCLLDFWTSQGQRFPQVRTLLINQDNGPENHTRRTQFMARLTQFADHCQLTLQLACYPPYHSKYNPIERVWGVLEKHWNGSLLDSLQTVLNFARSLLYKDKQPVVELIEKTYQSGVKLTKKLMADLEKRFERLPGLEKWFVRISPLATSTLA